MKKDNLIRKDNYIEKIDKMSNKKKFLVLFLFLAIFCSLLYIANVQQVTVIEYKHLDTVLCTETYINGKLNSTPCPQNNKFNKKEPGWIYELDYVNIT